MSVDNQQFNMSRTADGHAQLTHYSTQEVSSRTTLEMMPLSFDFDKLYTIAD